MPKAGVVSAREVRIKLANRGIIESTEWNGFKADDVVRVKGHTGTFKILSFRLSEEGNVLWVNMYGGIRGREQLHSFIPGDLIAPKKRKKT